MRRFNTTGPCIPRKHYMADITGRLAQTKAMVDYGDYFCINRPRQFGKTTTLAALRGYLAEEYVVLSLDLQGLSSEDYRSESAFVQGFCSLVLCRAGYLDGGIPEAVADRFASMEADVSAATLRGLLGALTDWCTSSDNPLVLIIDEVDSASDTQVFLDFLAILRGAYIDRDAYGLPALQSVILAGVTDVKHLRSKIRDEDQHKVNSPWNIAADYYVDMSLSPDDIAGMLAQYEADHATGMDLGAVAQQVYDWTSGYPFLASRICQLVDERVAREVGDLGKAWSLEGVERAVKLLLSEKNTLFESLTGKLTKFPEMREKLYGILMEGERVAYSPMQEDISQMETYGFITERNGTVVIANRVFEMLLYNLFLSDDELRGSRFSKAGDLERNAFVEGGRLDMRAVLEGFRKTYAEVYGPLDERFSEHEGRKLFLLYLRGVINGVGNYYIEAQTRDQTRTDVVVDYGGERFVVELKIWRGPRYNEAGERQVTEYLGHFGLDVGYMLSFNFNQQKKPGLKRVSIGDKVLYEETL